MDRRWLIPCLATAVLLLCPTFLFRCSVSGPYPVQLWREPIVLGREHDVAAVLASLELNTTSSARLLDAIGDQATETSQRALHLHQVLYCGYGYHLHGAPSSVTVLGNITLFGTANDFIIKILQKEAMFEEELVQQLEWGIHQYKGSGMPLVVDAGTNIGLFTVRAASAGARVASFEAMPFNVLYLRKMLCHTPWLLRAVTLYGVGLGSHRDECVVVSPHDNPSDGKTVCQADAPKLAMLESSGWIRRANMTVMPLDFFIKERVHVLKIDVEGSELSVLKGAASLIQQGLIKYIMAEVNEPLLNQEGKNELLRFLYAHHYICSYQGFLGQSIAIDEVESGAAGAVTGALLNIFCTYSQDRINL